MADSIFYVPAAVKPGETVMADHQLVDPQLDPQLDPLLARATADPEGRALVTAILKRKEARP